MSLWIFVTCMGCCVVLFRVIILFHSYMCHNCIGSSNYRGNDLFNHWPNAVWLATDSTSIVPPTRVLVPILPSMVPVATTTWASTHAHWHQYACQWRPHIRRTYMHARHLNLTISMSKPMPSQVPATGNAGAPFCTHKLAVIMYSAFIEICGMCFCLLICRKFIRLSWTPWRLNSLLRR